MEHDSYLSGVVQGLKDLNVAAWPVELPVEWAEVALSLAELDLGPLRPQLRACYASFAQNKSAPREPKEPLNLLRALVLGAALGVASPHRLVDHLKLHPILTLLTGFDPHAPAGSPTALPGASTLYDFLDRLNDGPWRPHDHPARPRRPTGKRGRFSRQLDDERQKQRELREAELRQAGMESVQLEVHRALARHAAGQGPPATLAARLNTLLAHAVVRKSAALGLLGERKDPETPPKVTLVLDGTPVESSAAPQGHPECTCPRSARCSCPRLYSDPDAQWGFDSYRDEFVFGDRASVLSTSHARDLPVHIRLEGANASDVVMGVRSLEETFKAFRAYLPHVRITSAAFDKGYDATAFYQLLTQLRIAPIIPLARPAKALHNDGAVEFSPEGIPLCPGLAPMRQHQYNREIEQLLFYCPAKQRGRQREVDLSHCPLGRLCEPESPMGPTVWVALESNPRLHLPLARDSDKFKALYAKRSGAERIFSQLKDKGASGTSRRRYMRQMRLVAHALGMHARAWVKARWPEPPDTIEALLAALAQVAAEAEAKAAARQEVLSQDAA